MENKHFEVLTLNAKDIKVASEIEETFLKGVFTKVLALTEVKMKGGKANPLIGRTYRLTEYNAYLMGTSYKNTIDNKSERKGNGEESKPRKSWHTAYNDFVEVDCKSGSKLYLKLQANEESTSHKTYGGYLVDGKAATSEQVAYIKANLQVSSNSLSATQKEVGLTEETRVRYELPHLENVISITQGARHYTPQARYAELTIKEQHKAESNAK